MYLSEPQQLSAGVLEMAGMLRAIRWLQLNERKAEEMSSVQSVLVLCLGVLCACEGSPGEARLELYDAASGDSRWQEVVPAQQFAVEQGAPDGLLRVAATDYCWTTTLLMDFELGTGREATRQRRGAYAMVGGGVPLLEPPTACASGLATQRLTLSSGELVDLCSYSGEVPLTVMNVAGGRERFRLPLGDWAPIHVSGDRLVLSEPSSGRSEAHSLLSGEPLWSWSGPDPDTTVAGIDAEHLYLLSPTSGQSHAIALADGTELWQKNLGCDSLSLAGDALVCQQTLRDSTCDHE
jgi:hypothetical protein